MWPDLLPTVSGIYSFKNLRHGQVCRPFRGSTRSKSMIQWQGVLSRVCSIIQCEECMRHGQDWLSTVSGFCNCKKHATMAGCVVESFRILQCEECLRHGQDWLSTSSGIRIPQCEECRRHWQDGVAESSRFQVSTM